MHYFIIGVLVLALWSMINGHRNAVSRLSAWADNTGTIQAIWIARVIIIVLALLIFHFTRKWWFP
jgi:hypothetical protein